MVEAGGIGEGGRATAGEDMDGAMADCGGRGTCGGAAAEAVAAAEKSNKVPTQKSPNIILGEEGTDPSILTKGMFSMYQGNLQICLCIPLEC